MMMCQVVPYSGQYKDAWDDFVQNRSCNGNIFHEQQFLTYHRDRFEDASILIFDRQGGRILAVIPAALKRGDSKIAIVSHPGSSYGAVVFAEGIKLRLLKDVLNTAIEYYYKTYNTDYMQLTLQEEFHTTNSFEELVFLLWHRGFKIESKEASCVKDLSDALPASYGKTIKQYIKSKKDQRLGISHDVVDAPAEIETCYGLIAENLKNKYSKSPVHSLEELIDLKSRYGERVTVFGSTFENRIIATVIVFVLDRYTVHDFYTSLDYEFGQMKPLFGLFDFIFNYYQQRGYKFFNFGISTRKYWIKWGILEFKEQFGTRILTRDIWKLDNLSNEWPCDGERK